MPICADESVHTSGDLDDLGDRYDAINIKLDKAGGLTEALHMRARARDLGFGVMIGSMVGTSLSMAPAVLLAQDADYVDLDGPLLLARDRMPSLRLRGQHRFAAAPRTLGVSGQGTARITQFENQLSDREGTDAWIWD